MARWWIGELSNPLIIMEKYLFSCDWGTSSFRLRLVDTDTGRVLGEALSPNGVAATFDAWTVAHNQTGIERAAYFCQFLSQQIARFPATISISVNQISVVVSGMASSSIGLAELPYASLPFALDGTGARTQWFEPTPDFDHRLLLISGICSPHDVMRGEETQLVGLGDLLVESGQYIVIFPGTHAKHLYVEDGKLVDFETFMTGELFGVLTRHTILKESTDTADLAALVHCEGDSFRRGVLASGSANLLQSLFRVRTNQLFGHLTQPQNALYLSGLLIGTELRGLQRQRGWQLMLCCDTNLVDFYEQAISILGLAKQTTKLDTDTVRQSVTLGHLKIREHQLALIEAA